MLHKETAVAQKSPKKAAAITASFPPHQMHVQNNFHGGDLLFGLGRSYRQNTYNVLLRCNAYPFILANDLNGRVIPEIISPSGSIDDFTAYEKGHYHFLMARHKYILKSGGRPVPSETSKPEVGVAFRRACKLLVITSHESRRSHFELDRISMERVCNPETNDLGVTNSELRALYRHAKKHGDNPHVFFYHQGLRCPPPWQQETHKVHWKAYDDYRTNKQKAKRTLTEDDDSHATTKRARK